MSHLVQQCNPSHLTVELLKALDNFAKCVQPSEDLFEGIFRRLILNFRLISQADVGTQRHLVQRLLYLSRVSSTNLIRLAY